MYSLYFGKHDIEALPTRERVIYPAKREVWKIVFLKVLKQCQFPFQEGNPPKINMAMDNHHLLYYGRCII